MYRYYGFDKSERAHRHDGWRKVNAEHRLKALLWTALFFFLFGVLLFSLVGIGVTR